MPGDLAATPNCRRHLPATPSQCLLRLRPELICCDHEHRLGRWRSSRDRLSTSSTPTSVTPYDECEARPSQFLVGRTIAQMSPSAPKSPRSGMRAMNCQYGLSSRADHSQPGNEFVIVSMGANPEPDDLISLTHSRRSIAEANSCRVDGARRMHLLEPQARVIWVLLEEPACRTGLALNVRG